MCVQGWRGLLGLKRVPVRVYCIVAAASRKSPTLQLDVHQVLSDHVLLLREKGCHLYVILGQPDGTLPLAFARVERTDCRCCTRYCTITRRFVQLFLCPGRD